MIDEYTMIVEVIGEPDESTISINKVSDLDMEVMYPMLMDIKAHQGYYPKGRFIRPNEPTARDLYHDYQAWDIFESIIPKPISGFSMIKQIIVFKDTCMNLEML